MLSSVATSHPSRRDEEFSSSACNKQGEVGGSSSKQTKIILDFPRIGSSKSATELEDLTTPSSPLETSEMLKSCETNGDDEEPSYYMKVEFKYRKSVFATIFAMCIVIAVLFLILYLRCHASYVKIVEHKGSQTCNKCPEHSYCNNELNQVKFQCTCRAGYYAIQQGADIICKDVSFYLPFPQSPISKKIEVESKQLNNAALTNKKQHNEISVCYWLKSLSSNKISNHFNTILSSENFKISISNVTLQLHQPQQSGQKTLDIPLIHASQWHHLCLTFSSKNTTVFLNGQQHVTLDKGTFYINYQQPILFGVGFDISSNDSTRENYFVGEISQMYVVAGILTQVDVPWFLNGRLLKTENIILSWSDILNKSKRNLMQKFWL